MTLSDNFTNGMKRPEPVAKATLLSAVVLLIVCACATTGNENTQKATAHYQMGLSYLNDNNIQPAFVEFQKALELNPRNKEVHDAIGLIYLLKLEDYTKAIEHFQKALSIDRNFSEASNNLGFAYEKAGRLNDAIESYNASLSNPLYINAEKAYNNLGRAFYRAKKYDDSLNAYKESIKRSSDFYLPYYGLALCYNAMGHYGDAATALKRAIELDPAYRGDKEKAANDIEGKRLLLKGDEERDMEDLLEIMNY